MTQKFAVLSPTLYSAELGSTLFPDTGYIAEVFYERSSVLAGK
jgi:hypothetical protein